MSAAWKQTTAAKVMPMIAATYSQRKPASGITYQR